VAKVNWYEKDVILVVDKATDEVLTKLANHVQGQTRVNIQANGQIDTGFMINAVYAITPLPNDRPRVRALVEARAAADRPLAPAFRIAKHGEAAIHGAAEYTIHQEMRKPFLYPALVSAAKIADGAIREVGRTWF
jgi:hypothetical protein